VRVRGPQHGRVVRPGDGVEVIQKPAPTPEQGLVLESGQATTHPGSSSDRALDRHRSEDLPAAVGGTQRTSYDAAIPCDGAPRTALRNHSASRPWALDPTPIWLP
jgi:hypothetical protein